MTDIKFWVQHASPVLWGISQILFMVDTQKFLVLCLPVIHSHKHITSEALGVSIRLVLRTMFLATLIAVIFEVVRSMVDVEIKLRGRQISRATKLQMHTQSLWRSASGVTAFVFRPQGTRLTYVGAVWAPQILFAVGIMAQTFALSQLPVSQVNFLRTCELVMLFVFGCVRGIVFGAGMFRISLLLPVAVMTVGSWLAWITQPKSEDQLAPSNHVAAMGASAMAWGFCRVLEVQAAHNEDPLGPQQYTVVPTPSTETTSAGDLEAETSNAGSSTAMPNSPQFWFDGLSHSTFLSCHPVVRLGVSSLVVFLASLFVDVSMPTEAFQQNTFLIVRVSFWLFVFTASATAPFSLHPDMSVSEAVSRCLGLVVVFLASQWIATDPVDALLASTINLCGSCAFLLLWANTRNSRAVMLWLVLAFVVLVLAGPLVHHGARAPPPQLEPNNPGLNPLPSSPRDQFPAPAMESVVFVSIPTSESRAPPATDPPHDPSSSSSRIAKHVSALPGYHMFGDEYKSWTQCLHDLRDAIHQEALSALGPTLGVGDSHVVFVGVADHANIGDTTIALGTELFFRDAGVHVRHRFGSSATVDTVAQVISPDSIIVCHGGGNFGNLWPVHHNFRMELVRRFPHNRFVMMPQTIHFTAQGPLAATKRVLLAHNDVHILLRDVPSLEFCRQEFPSADCRFCHDMALYVGRLRVLSAPSAHLIVVSRLDKEAVAERMDTAQIAEVANVITEHEFQEGQLSHSNAHWAIEEHTTSSVPRAPYISNSQPNHQFVVKFDDWLHHDVTLDTAPPTPGSPMTLIDLLLRRLERGVAVIGSGKVLASNRLHANIIAFLLGMPHIILESAYPKTRNVFAAILTRDAAACGKLKSVLSFSAQDMPSAVSSASDLLQRGLWFHPNTFVFAGPASASSGKMTLMCVDFGVTALHSEGGVIGIVLDPRQPVDSRCVWTRTPDGHVLNLRTLLALTTPHCISTPLMVRLAYSPPTSLQRFGITADGRSLVSELCGTAIGARVNQNATTESADEVHFFADRWGRAILEGWWEAQESRVMPESFWRIIPLSSVEKESNSV